MSDATAAAHPSEDSYHHHDPKATSTGIEHKKLMMWLFLASDCMFFGTLISVHLVYRKLWPTGEHLPAQIFDIELTTFSSFILLISSFFMALAVSAMHKGEIRVFRQNVFVVIIFGLIFLGIQTYEFSHFVSAYGFTLTSGTFGSTFYLMTGTHGVHVAVGVIWLTGVLFFSYNPRFTAQYALDVEVAGLYWHFVDIVWIVIFTSVYLVEYIPFQ